MQVVAALEKKGHTATTIDVREDVIQKLGRLDPRPDVFFNALHGRFGEDGCIQGVLNFLGIPFTHSDVLASAVAMDKPAAKAMLTASGIPFPEHRMETHESLRRALATSSFMEPPFVIKPRNEGSTIGVYIVNGTQDIERFLADDWRHHPEFMVERYVPGKELSVPVLGDRALEPIEIRPVSDGFYTYEAKYGDGGSEHVVPAAIHPDALAEAKRIALAAHRALGCEGVSRVDFRYDDTRGEPGRLFVLEVNTQPGLTPTSLVPDAARHEGMSFADLIDWMLRDAVARWSARRG
jgi:D-alanine-D-alanine ligase